MPNWKKLITSGSDASLNSLNLSSVVNAGTDTDKFLVLDGSGNVDFRTGENVLSDIGGQASGVYVSESAQIDHDQTTNFVAGEHFLQSAITTVGTVTTGDVSAILPDGTVSGSSQITGFVTDAGGSAGQVGVWSSGTALSGSNNLFLDTSNNRLGIGTLSPPEALTVEGNISGSGDINISGTLTAAVKSFDIPHPTEDNKRLVYGVLEGPEHAVYVRGESKVDTVYLPEVWTGLVDEKSITVQLTGIGSSDPYYYIEYKNNSIKVGGPENKHYFYFIQATRKDIDKLITVQ